LSVAENLPPAPSTKKNPWQPDKSPFDYNHSTPPMTPSMFHEGAENVATGEPGNVKSYLYDPVYEADKANDAPVPPENVHVTRKPTYIASNEDPAEMLGKLTRRPDAPAFPSVESIEAGEAAAKSVGDVANNAIRNFRISNPGNPIAASNDMLGKMASAYGAKAGIEAGEAGGQAARANTPMASAPLSTGGEETANLGTPTAPVNTSQNLYGGELGQTPNIPPENKSADLRPVPPRSYPLHPSQATTGSMVPAPPSRDYAMHPPTGATTGSMMPSTVIPMGGSAPAPAPPPLSQQAIPAPYQPAPKGVSNYSANEANEQQQRMIDDTAAANAARAAARTMRPVVAGGSANLQPVPPMMQPAQMPPQQPPMATMPLSNMQQMQMPQTSHAEPDLDDQGGPPDNDEDDKDAKMKALGHLIMGVHHAMHKPKKKMMAHRMLT
jgi:hypothetical protein